MERHSIERNLLKPASPAAASPFAVRPNDTEQKAPSDAARIVARMPSSQLRPDPADLLQPVSSQSGRMRLPAHMSLIAPLTKPRSPFKPPPSARLRKMLKLPLPSQQQSLPKWVEGPEPPPRLEVPRANLSRLPGRELPVPELGPKAKWLWSFVTALFDQDPGLDPDPLHMFGPSSSTYLFQQAQDALKEEGEGHDLQFEGKFDFPPRRGTR
ncbi:hypothetical protein GLA29479_1807 [Lysobacter antibioticus]|uniref:hypothetical protein n=1 Tax=Lysobacter antibioticus TaxID=84531 RepID=UPI000720CBE5|nr:hypothetical protein [Lysobacter antibioticus]ALN62681.1 hypothetical protein GLA29479_1807 [Lysobacter antibioticus]